MFRASLIWILILNLSALLGCGPDLEKETFDLYLYDKQSGEEIDMGEVVGLTHCRNKAEAAAPYYNLIEYDFACCLKTSGSKCEKKYR